MNFIKLKNHIINLEEIKHIKADSGYIRIYFKNTDCYTSIEYRTKKEAEEVLNQIYETMSQIKQKRVS